LNWYVVSVSTEQNFSQIFEAISSASNHALNNARFTEKLRIDDYKYGRVFLVQDISDMKNKIEVSWGLSPLGRKVLRILNLIMFCTA
jgi:hypothetical protein